MNDDKWIVESGDFSLAFSSANGAICSGTIRGKQVLVESPEAFRLGFTRFWSG